MYDFNLKKIIFLVTGFIILSFITHTAYCKIFYDASEFLENKTYQFYGAGRGYSNFEDFKSAGVAVHKVNDSTYNVFFVIADPKNDSIGRVERVRYSMFGCGIIRNRLTLTEPPWIQFNSQGEMINTQRNNRSTKR